MYMYLGALLDGYMPSNEIFTAIYFTSFSVLMIIQKLIEFPLQFDAIASFPS